MKITGKQFTLLQDFMFHCWNVYHNKTKSAFDFWAERLDEAKIPWSIQNLAASLMEDRENGFRYFRELLSLKGIEIME